MSEFLGATAMAMVMAKQGDKPLIGGQLLLAVLALALAVPLGFVVSHVITPFLWWMELRVPMSLTGAEGPAWFVTLASMLFAWGVLHAVTGMVIEHRKAGR